MKCREGLCYNGVKKASDRFPGGAMGAKLRILKGKLRGETFQLNFGDTFVVGRDDSCNIPLIEDGVSRRHFTVEGRGHSFILTDLGSSNGTLVNGKPVKSKVLRQQDIVCIGGVELEFTVVPEMDEPTRRLVTFEPMDTAIMRRIEEKEIGKDLPRRTAPQRKRLEKMLSTLYQVGNIISAEIERDRILQTIMDAVMSVLQADRGFLILYDSETDVLDPVVVRGEEESTSKLNLSRSILSECVKGGVSILSTDTMQDDRFKTGASIILHNIRSALCVPMESKNSILGALYVDNLTTPGAFTDYDLEMLAAIGKQAGIAIGRLHLIEQLESLFYGSIRTLIATIEAKDHYTKGHTERVTTYAMQIAHEMELPPEDVESLQLASLLHDVGKIGIPEKILKKPGKLTPGEYEIMKRHPGIGAEIVGNIDNIHRVRDIVLSHHEKWDGTGYPEGRSGDQTPLGARILAVADAYDAMTSTRSYRRNFSEDEVIKEFKRCAGFQFDRDVVDAFFRAYKHSRIVPPHILSVDQILPKGESS
ncbi:MAG: HD domain-containing phosphohydrolase [Planctomycetota bacterium]